MRKEFKLVFISILLFSVYHLVRDILQILNLNSAAIEILHRSHQWCSPGCDYVTLPLDLFGAIGSIVALKKDKLEVVGILALLTIPVWLIAFLLP